MDRDCLWRARCQAVDSANYPVNGVHAAHFRRPSKPYAPTSSQAKKGSQSGVIFETFDARDVLRRHPPGMPFLLGLHDSPKLNDTILYNDILVGQMRPALRLEFGKKPPADGTVVEAFGSSRIGRFQSLQQ